MTRRELTLLSRKKRMLVARTVMEIAKVISDDVYSSWNSVKDFFFLILFLGSRSCNTWAMVRFHFLRKNSSMRIFWNYTNLSQTFVGG